MEIFGDRYIFGYLFGQQSLVFDLEEKKTIHVFSFSNMVEAVMDPGMTFKKIETCIMIGRATVKHPLVRVEHI